MIVYRELASLERDLGIPAARLYAVSNQLHRHYHRRAIPRKNGEPRLLSVPDEALKAIQRRIADVLLFQRPVSPWATAYRYAASPRKNAALHAGQPLVLKLDIYHFFDSIRYTQVKDSAFPAEIYAEPLRILLTMLCYYKDGLPQGAPSSPAITNILLYDFDEKLALWCQARNIRYSRYCDDMTFSGDFDPAPVIAHVRQELKALGFLLNEQKTAVQRRGRRQLVTGLVVNEHPSAPAEYRRQLRQELYYLKKFGPEEHLRHRGIAEPPEHYLRRLLGRADYMLSVSPADQDAREARDWLCHTLREYR